MRRVFFFFIFMVTLTAQAEILLPVSGDKLGLGGHLRMHRAITVDSASPDSSLYVTASGETRVKSIRINQQRLIATPTQLNRLSEAITVDPGASSIVTVNNQGLYLSNDDDGITFYDGARIYKHAGGGLRIKPHEPSIPVIVRDASDAIDQLVLMPATNAEAIDGSIPNKPITPASLKAVLDNAFSSGAILTASKTWDPPYLTNSAKTSTDITVSGAEVGDVCVPAHTTIRPDGLNHYLFCYVSAHDIVTVWVACIDAPVNWGSGTLTVKVFK